MFCESSSTVNDSTRLRGLNQFLSQSEIASVIGDQLGTRFCKRINNQQLIWLIVGMGLFAGKSYRQIFRLCWTSKVFTPSRSTLTLARKRLAADLLHQLYLGVVKLLATSPKKHAFGFYRGLRLVGIDGTLLDCPDTDSNREEFGRTSNQTSYGAFPKVRVVSLCELATRVLWRSVIGTYRQSEQKLTLELMDYLDSSMLLLADRHFGVAPIIYRLLQRMVPFLIRAKKSQLFIVEKLLSDGSYLSTIYLGKNDRSLKRPGKTIRVIRYTHHDCNRTGCGEVHVLLTSLLDDQKYPAAELIELYHVRWEEEIAFSEWKVAMCEGKMLRSQSPEMVRQEIWGMLLSHFILRKIIFASAQKAGVEPVKISFTGAMDILHARLPEVRLGQAIPRKWIANLLDEIGREQLPPRANRINPRKLKKRSKPWPTKKDCDRRPPKPEGSFINHVKISI